MEIIIILAIIAILGYTLYNQINKAPSTTETSAEPAVASKVEEAVKEVVAEVKAEVATVKEVAKKTTARAKKALDVNQDGKVNAKDAVAAVKKVAAKTAKPKAVKK